jgi:hypothetical protein
MHEPGGKATETKEQLTHATPLTLVTTLSSTNPALPSSNLCMRSSSTTPTTPPSSHPWICLHEEWPAGSRELGREQNKESIEHGREQEKEATSALAPTGVHLVKGRDLGRATSGGSGSSWMSMRMAGRFGPPLPPLPRASQAPGRPGDTPPAARAAGSWDHADFMSSRAETSHARPAAPAGVNGLTGNVAVGMGANEMGAERPGQVTWAGASVVVSNLDVPASKVEVGGAKGWTKAPLLELDEDLVQASVSISFVVFGDGLPRRHGLAWHCRCSHTCFLIGTADAHILALSLTRALTTTDTFACTRTPHTWVSRLCITHMHTHTHTCA